ncbi:hypothetical protein ACT7DA_24700 [Bacillus pacificus]
MFGEGVLAIKLLNILYCTGITYFIYRIATHLFNEFGGRVAALIFATYIPNIMMTSVLTNQHLATFLFYGGFYLLVKKESRIHIRGYLLVFLLHLAIL